MSTSRIFPALAPIRASTVSKPRCRSTSGSMWAVGAARMTLADAELLAAQYRLEIARADLALDVRNPFAAAVAARDSLALARENETRARERVRVAQALVDTDTEPERKRVV